MPNLFRRKVRLEVDTLIIEGLDIRFSIVKDEKAFGKAEISIFNLNKDHRAQLEQKQGVDTTLFCGYEGQDLGMFFRGTMRTVFSAKEPPDWVTTLQTGDGDKATGARVNRSYSKGTKLETMWKDLLDSLSAQGIGAGNAIDAFKRGDFKDGIKELVGGGGTLQGPTLKEVYRLAQAANLDFRIEDGECQVTPIGEPLGATAIVLSPSSGLIGSPQKGDKGLLKVKALLIPGLFPKRKVEIRSSSFSGIYVVRKGSYKGDTSGNEWYADLECKEAP